MSPESGIWNPWHGCTRYSEGCAHCYVYRRDESVGRDASKVFRTRDFDLPLRRDRAGNYKIPPGSHLYVCMTSDFLLDLADGWREEIWQIMRERADLSYTVITKRALRFMDCLPDDWGDGWDNFALVCTVENQLRADRRLPVFMELPVKHRYIACEPLLTPIELADYLSPSLCGLVAGGESGPGARVCDYDWILSLRAQCLAAGVPFYFKQTGANFRKDGRLYSVPRPKQHEQAWKAGINSDWKNR